MRYPNTGMMVPGPMPTDNAAAHHTEALHRPQCMLSSACAFTCRYNTHAPHLAMDSELLDLLHDIKEEYELLMLTQLAGIQSTLITHGEELGAIRRACIDITEQEHSIYTRIESLKKDAAHVAQDLANIALLSDRGQENDDVGNGNKASNNGRINAPDMIYDQVQKLA